MKPLSIVFIIDGLGGGGAEKVVLTLAGAMSAQGHDVSIISLRTEQSYPIPGGVRFLMVADRYKGPFHRQTEVWRRACQLDKIVEQFFAGREIDLAISNLPMTDRIVSKSRRLQNVWMCLHGAVATSQLSRRAGIRRFFKKRQLQKTYNGRNLITTSSGLQIDITELGGTCPEKMITIPNPFDLDKIGELSKGLCPLAGERFVIHVGRFKPVKRHDRLFEAFHLSKYPGKLVLLGGGNKQQEQEMRQMCRQIGIANRVLFSGFVANPYPYMRAAEALLLSSDFEGFGNVLVEALACNTPAVSTNCPYGPREILTGDLARGLSELSAESLAQCLNAILADPPVISLKQLERFSIKNIMAQYLALPNGNHA